MDEQPHWQMRKAELTEPHRCRRSGLRRRGPDSSRVSSVVLAASSTFSHSYHLHLFMTHRPLRDPESSRAV